MYHPQDHTYSFKRQKLELLAEIEGFRNVQSLLEHYIHDSILPAICTRASCEGSAMLEPDQRAGWCECCDTNSMASALVIAELI